MFNLNSNDAYLMTCDNSHYREFLHTFSLKFNPIKTVPCEIHFLAVFEAKLKALVSA